MPTLTSSSLQHEGFKTLLEELKLVHKFWLLFGQLENAAEAGSLHAQATELPQAPVNVNCRQACQAYLDAMQHHARSMHQCNQRVLQAFKALHADQQLKRLLEQDLSVAAKVARMHFQVQTNDIYMKDFYTDFEEFSAAVQYLPVSMAILCICCSLQQQHKSSLTVCTAKDSHQAVANSVNLKRLQLSVDIPVEVQHHHMCACMQHTHISGFSCQQVVQV